MSSHYRDDHVLKSARMHNATASEELSEQAIAQTLQAQVKAWKTAKPERRGATEAGVPVIRLKKKPITREHNRM
jgi:hypothetical protein